MEALWVEENYPDSISQDGYFCLEAKIIENSDKLVWWQFLEKLIMLV